MADKWVAECLPCRWETRHDDEDAAIAAAEDHVFTLHRKMRAVERSAARVGHVQNRTVTDLGESASGATADHGAPPAPADSQPAIAGDVVPTSPPQLAGATE